MQNLLQTLLRLIADSSIKLTLSMLSCRSEEYKKKDDDDERSLRPTELF